MMENLGDRRLNMEALRQRLRQVGAPVRSTPPPSVRQSPAPVDGSLKESLGGEEIEGCHVITASYEAAHHHAGIPLQSLWQSQGQALAWLTSDPSLNHFDFRETLFIDTETNGLAGGAGTYAFLIGVAYWAEGSFHVQQFFMRHPREEAVVLARLSPLLERFSSFVSFNGKSFDLSVLEARYILTRQPRALKKRPHLDLLHPARRLWKLRLPSCSLGSLEQRILGASRDQSDVPGYLIPQLYNTFLRDGNAAPLQGVFYHNHQDLLALAALAVYMVRLCTDPERHTPPHGQDHVALGRLYDDNQQWEQAERCYRRALTMPLPQSLRSDCLCRLSLLLKRAARWEEATSLWRSLLDTGVLYPYIELAKYHEHQSRDLAAAERAVLAALDLSLTHEEALALTHRLERIRQKQQRQVANPPC
ncbi:MAG: ribonuclease H-like domain-containing protein [Ardenticatenales bacterium]|nr:ribonuclease H-like domain-containing protein [Ardenticatenales bacterium]